MKIELTKGKLLVSEPSILTDRAFNRSVVYLTEITTDGCVGFIINKSTKYTLNDLLPDINCDFKIFNGGPVERESLYFMHNIPHLIPNSVAVANNIYWGGDFKVVANLLKEKIISSSEIQFFLGYSGWSNEQLTDEIKEASWVVVENEFSNLFSINRTKIWKDQLMKLGGAYQIWANAPKNPSLN